MYMNIRNTCILFYVVNNLFFGSPSRKHNKAYFYGYFNVYFDNIITASMSDGCRELNTKKPRIDMMLLDIYSSAD